jgi:hypothetical protein
MKKLLLLIPVGLLAATGLFWMNVEDSKVKVSSVESLSVYPQEIFASSEHSLRQVIRHGNEKSLSEFKNSLDKLDSSLIKYKEQGLVVETTEEMIVQYRQDGMSVTKAASPYLKKLDTCSDFERDNEKAFAVSLNQIGLYKLKTINASLDKARSDYIKEPSAQAEQNYFKIASNMKQTISELYLDGLIEQPLFDYIDNHNSYVKTVASIYNEVGSERIYRLQEQGYAIKTQLQLLPKL